MIEKRIIKREGLADTVEARVVKQIAPEPVVSPKPESVLPTEDEEADRG